MRDMVPAWFSALLWRGAEAAFVVAVAVTCGSYVESSAQARQAAWQARMSPNSITPLSASLTEEAPRSPPHYGLMAAPNCAPQLTLAARDGALIVLTLQAACAADGRVEITHAGMTFAARMPIGRPLRLTLPALDAAGEVLAVLPGGMQARAAVALPDLRALHRFAVTAPTAEALQLQGDPEAGGGADAFGRCRPCATAAGAGLYLSGQGRGTGAGRSDLLGRVLWPEPERSNHLQPLWSGGCDGVAGRSAGMWGATCRHALEES